jgi:hypothetical protein
VDALLNADVDYQRILSLAKTRSELIDRLASFQTEGILKAMLAEIDGELETLVQKFTGNVRTEAVSVTYDLIPRAGAAAYHRTARLFDLDATGPCNLAGARNNADYTLRPVVALAARACAGATEQVRLSMSITVRGDYSGAVDRFRGPLGPPAAENGLVYRIPALTDIRLRRGNAELTVAQIQVAQLGTTAYLPTTTGGRKTQYTAELNAAGGLKNILISQEAVLNATMAASVGSAITGLQDAKIAADKANAPKAPKTQREIDEEAFRAARAKACLADPLNEQCANIK